MTIRKFTFFSLSILAVPTAYRAHFETHPIEAKSAHHGL